MHVTKKPSERIIAPDPETATFKSVAVELKGRLMCSDFSEYKCVAVAMSPIVVDFRCAARPRAGERIVAYIDHIGRIEGRVAQTTVDGFSININATDRKRQKLSAQLEWFSKRNEVGVSDHRRHERIIPRSPNAEIKLPDGDTYPCRIVDLSMSGAALELEVRPKVGTQVVLGSMRARVVRQFEDGIAIEFATIQPPESLETYI
jgi:hypothetical protein